MTDEQRVEQVAIALANHDGAKLDLPLIKSIEGLRFDADANEYIAMARAAIEALAPNESHITAEPMSETGDQGDVVGEIVAWLRGDECDIEWETAEGFADAIESGAWRK